MELDFTNILTYNPELILQDALLNEILNKFTFKQFFDAIYQYPNVYEGCFKKQVYWEVYYRKNYDINSLLFKNNINWFFEIIIQEFGIDREYFVNVLTGIGNIFPNIIDNFKRYTEDNYLNRFKLINKFPFKDIKTISGQSLNTFFTLSDNGNVTEIIVHSKNIIKQNIILNNVKKMIYNGISNDKLYFLTKDGILYTKFFYALIKQSFDFIIENIQSDDVNGKYSNNMISLQDSKNNIYTIGFNNEVNTIRHVFLENPLLRNTPVLSYAITHSGMPEFMVPNYNYQQTNNYIDFQYQETGIFHSILYYVTLDGKLYKRYFDNCIPQTEPILVSFDNSLFIKSVQVKSVRFLDQETKRTKEIILCIYQDSNDNIYIQNDNYDFVIKYHFGNSAGYEEEEERRIKDGTINSRIVQFMIDNQKYVNYPIDRYILLFMTQYGELFYIEYQSNLFLSEMRDINLFKEAESTKLVPGTKILYFSGNENILEVINKNEYVLMPYPLFLLYVIQKRVDKYLVKDKNIIFRILGLPYTFQTNIPEEN